MARTMLRYADIEKKIQKYFDECDALNGGEKKLVKPYTLSGLICSMGVTRAEFEKLMRNKKYAQKLYGAKAKIEAFIEENALIGGLSANAAANSLKYNFGWGEKTNTDEINTSARSLIISLDRDAEILAR